MKRRRDKKVYEEEKRLLEAYKMSFRDHSPWYIKVFKKYPNIKPTKNLATSNILGHAFKATPVVWFRFATKAFIFSILFFGLLIIILLLKDNFKYIDLILLMMMFAYSIYFFQRELRTPADDIGITVNKEGIRVGKQLFVWQGIYQTYIYQESMSDFGTRHLIIEYHDKTCKFPISELNASRRKIASAIEYFKQGNEQRKQ